MDDTKTTQSSVSLVSRQLRLRQERKLLKLRLQAEYAGKGQILDIGFAANPNPYLEDATGIDIHPPKEKPLNYKASLACNLNTDTIPAEPGTFDAVVAGDVIEHVESPSHFLREINRVLKSDGRLVLCTPQANDWWVTLHNWFFRSWINDPDPGEHLQNWTMIDMTRLLRKNGFVVDRIEGFYMSFPKISLRIRVRRFPALSWQVIYIAHKVAAPDTSILVCVDGETVHVPQQGCRV